MLNTHSIFTQRKSEIGREEKWIFPKYWYIIISDVIENDSEIERKS